MWDHLSTLFVSALSLTSKFEVARHSRALLMNSLSVSRSSDENFDLAVLGRSSVPHASEIFLGVKQISCVCTTRSSVEARFADETNHFEDDIVYSYTQFIESNRSNSGTSDWFPEDLTDASCILFDSKRNYLWLISDLVGASPIWYSIHHSMYNPTTQTTDSNRIVATTDLILALRLGYKQPTPLAAGQIVAIDLDHMEIIRLQFRDARRRIDKYANPEYYAYNLLSSSMQVIDMYMNLSENSSILVENDRSEPSSVLLECTLNSLGTAYSARFARSLVQDVPSAYPPELVEIIRDISDDFSAPSSDVWSPKFSRVAFERWLLCEAAIVPGTLLSFDVGVHSRPLQVYLQNLFCGYLNVKVVYPFNSKSFQKSLWSTIYLNRLVLSNA